MVRYHLVKSGVVENTVVWDAAPPPNAYPGFTVIDGAIGGPGWTWDGTTLSSPIVVTPAPATITRLQLVLGLAASGLITEAEADAMAEGSGVPAAISAAIQALPSAQRLEARIRFKAMTEVERVNPLIDAIGFVAAGKSPAEMDDYFRTWSQL